MARRVLDSKLQSREGRSKLEARGKPHWKEIERGLHVGYRRLKGRAGTWWCRHYLGNRAYVSEGLGAADDLTDADGLAILDFWQAQDKARSLFKVRARAAAGKTGPLTVAGAMQDYLQFIRDKRRSARSAESHYRAHIADALGTKEVESLTAK